jgi:hypothetical protein
VHRIILIVSAIAVLVSLDTLQGQTVHDDKLAQPGWSRGLSLLDSGQISTALFLIDSLNDTSTVLQAGIDTIMRKVFTVFLPSKRTFTAANIDSNDKSILDTLTDAAYRYRYFSSKSDSGSSFPAFGFNASFPVTRPYRLLFNGLQNARAASLTAAHQSEAFTLDHDLVSQIENKNDSISCSVFIDLKNSQVSMHEYIKTYIDGVYDSIATLSDLHKYNALSLRCYKRKNYSFENGKFVAIIAFDRLIPDRKVKKGKLMTTPLPVRYMVVVESVGSVRELAEAKLQTILKAL